MLLVAVRSGWRNLREITVTGGRARPVFAGREARFDLHLQAEGDRCGLLLALDPDRPVTTDLHAHSGTGVELALPAARRGVLPVRTLHLWTSFPLGLCTVRTTLPVELDCLVYPQPCPGRTAVRAQAKTGTEPPLARHGRPRVSGLAAYRPGDSLQQLHWKSFACGQGCIPGCLPKRRAAVPSSPWTGYREKTWNTGSPASASWCSPPRPAPAVTACAWAPPPSTRTGDRATATAACAPWPCTDAHLAHGPGKTRHPAHPGHGDHRHPAPPAEHLGGRGPALRGHVVLSRSFPAPAAARARSRAQDRGRRAPLPGGGAHQRRPDRGGLCQPAQPDDRAQAVRAAPPPRRDHCRHPLLFRHCQRHVLQRLAARDHLYRPGRARQHRGARPRAAAHARPAAGPAPGRGPCPQGPATHAGALPAVPAGPGRAVGPALAHRGEIRVFRGDPLRRHRPPGRGQRGGLPGGVRRSHAAARAALLAGYRSLGIRRGKLAAG